MSAAKNTIKATEPMPAYHDADCNVMHATEAEQRAAQAAKWASMFVAFDYEVDGVPVRVVGQCVGCRLIGRSPINRIPDYSIEIQSVRVPSRRTTINLLDARCEFYGTLDAARKDPLMVRGKGAQV
jgi:hypothetical protein